jgi:hypothetical protein
MTILLKNSTVAGVAPLPANLSEGELALNSADGKAFMKLNNGTVKELGGAAAPAPSGGWVRNPSWLPMPETTVAQEEVDILVAVFPDSNYVALTAWNNFTDTMQINWGDGQGQQFEYPGVIYHNYDYNSSTLANTNGSVTFSESASTVNRQAHGYTNGMKISFDTVVTTTGIVPTQFYYVISATTNTFQLSATQGGTAITLTNNGSGTILPYKQAMIKITSVNAGRFIDLVDLSTKHNAAGLGNYSQPWLDIISSARCSTQLIISGGANPSRMLERCNVLKFNGTELSNMFFGASSLQSLSMPDTSTATGWSNNMFYGCSSLQTVPLFNTAGITSMQNMFVGCSSLQTVPQFNTISATNMDSMFNGCSSLQTVPLLNTVNNTQFSYMFYNCTNLQTVPVFNTINSTSFWSMFQGCINLQTVPDINFSAPSMAYPNYVDMFAGCSSLSKIGNGTANFGPKFSFSIANCKFSANALNALYTSLPNVSGQTITVSGNIGTATDNPSIATAKGWTVSGS